LIVQKRNCGAPGRGVAALRFCKVDAVVEV
jgi:hypothetical protein